VSPNFDRTGFQQDWNVVLPLDRLHEMAREGTIGSVAAFHYSFMGATHPSAMAASVHELARLLTQDQVNAVLLVPV
jgi:D-proline reductase (dithiol) PrdB